MLLIGLLNKYFMNNLFKIPAHVIYVDKQDVLNIQDIFFSFDYSAVNLTSSSAFDLSKLVYLCKL